MKEKLSPVPDASADLPFFNWNQMIDMTTSENRPICIALSDVHEAITANTRVLLEILKELENRG